MRRRQGGSLFAYLIIVACIVVLGASAYLALSSPPPGGLVLNGASPTPVPVETATPVPTPSPTPFISLAPATQLPTTQKPTTSPLDIPLPLLIGGLAAVMMVVLLLFLLSKLARRRRRRSFDWQALPTIAPQQAAVEPDRTAIDDLLASFETDLANAKKNLERGTSGSASVAGATAIKKPRRLPNPFSLFGRLRAAARARATAREALTPSSWEAVMQLGVPTVEPTRRRLRIRRPDGAAVRRRVLLAGGVFAGFIVVLVAVINLPKVGVAVSGLQAGEQLLVAFAVVGVLAVVGLAALTVRLRRHPLSPLPEPEEPLEVPPLLPMLPPRPKVEAEIEAPVVRAPLKPAEPRPSLADRWAASAFGRRFGAPGRRGIALGLLVVLTLAVAAVAIGPRISPVLSGLAAYIGSLDGTSKILAIVALFIFTGLIGLIAVAVWYERKQVAGAPDAPAGADSGAWDAALSGQVDGVVDDEPRRQLPDIDGPPVSARRRRRDLFGRLAFWRGLHRPRLHWPTLDLSWLFPSRGDTYPGVDLMELTPEDRKRVRKARRPIALPLWLFDLLRWPSLRLPRIEVEGPGPKGQKSPKNQRRPLPRPHLPTALVAAMAAFGAALHAARVRLRARLHRPAFLHKRPLPAWLAHRPSAGKREAALFVTGLLLLGLGILTWHNQTQLPSVISDITASPTIIIASPTPTSSPTITSSPLPSLTPGPTLSPSPAPTPTPVATPSPTTAPDIYATRRASLPVCSGKPNCRLYNTRPGDYLRAIAHLYLGPSEADYQRLLKFNPQHANDPNLIYSNEQIFIPD